MTCRYSKCNKEYYACPSCQKLGSYKSCGCCVEHYAKYQNEVAYFRGKEFPYPDLLEEMVAEGSLPESVIENKK